MNKEHNFISAVVFLSEDDEKNDLFLKKLSEYLNDRFYHFEMIAINCNCKEKKPVHNWLAVKDKPLTLINMSLHQSHEQCMNAGLDISIGDYVYEFDSVEIIYPFDSIGQAYEKALQGNDIVNVCPKQERWSSKLFYGIFNRYSNSQYKLRTDAFRLVSRRAINRTHAISDNLPYRKAAYAACGLRIATIEFDGRTAIPNNNRFDLATSSLVFYTDFGYRFSLRITLGMLFLAFIELIYTLIIWVIGNPISGWTTTMLVLTIGFFGVFSVLAISLKYLSLIIQVCFKKQSYQVESIDKY